MSLDDAIREFTGEQIESAIAKFDRNKFGTDHIDDDIGDAWRDYVRDPSAPYMEYDEWLLNYVFKEIEI